MRAGLERLAAFVGDRSIADRDPRSPMSFSTVGPEVLKSQTEMLAHYSQGEDGVFSPLGPDGRPLRRWVGLFVEGEVDANEDFAEYPSASASIGSTAKRMDCHMPVRILWKRSFSLPNLPFRQRRPPPRPERWQEPAPAATTSPLELRHGHDEPPAALGADIHRGGEGRAPAADEPHERRVQREHGGEACHQGLDGEGCRAVDGAVGEVEVVEGGCVDAVVGPALSPFNTAATREACRRRRGHGRHEARPTLCRSSYPRSLRSHFRRGLPIRIPRLLPSLGRTGESGPIFVCYHRGEAHIGPRPASSLYACIITSPSSHLFFLSYYHLCILLSASSLSLPHCARARIHTLLALLMTPYSTCGTRAGARRSGSQSTTIQEQERSALLLQRGAILLPRETPLWMLYPGSLSDDTPAFSSLVIS